MNLTLKLLLSEIVKNKSKVLIAIIVTLILFMSAFTLCNISTALPVNFYGYYEEYMPSTIGITITNADEQLYNKSTDYFATFTPSFEKACANYSLVFDGREQLSFKEEEDNDGNIIATNYFNNVFLSKDSGEYSSQTYSRFFAPELGGCGTIWDEEYSKQGIWISKSAAEYFVDENENYQNVEALIGENLQYKYGNNMVDLEIVGVFNGEELKKYIVEQSGSSLVNDYLCFITENTAKKILFESGSTFNAYGVVGKIDKLYDVYNALHGKYSLSEGTAFGLIARVKNAQVICMIVGIIMIVCGIIIMLNFINMIISQNIKHISLLRILGTNSFRIMMAYYLIFMLMITIVCVISWMTLPLYNYFVSLYCKGLGYPFSIDINYWVVIGVFAVCYATTSLVMLVKWRIMEGVAPSSNIAEED